ncbi:MAG: transcriptional regulator, GntR family with aminotransferase domain containing protein [Firmicutes bacterium]|nr:transcriptional regulator, GntR family with aminotransferase domain containing protein [Bacillota bacterium]
MMFILNTTDRHPLHVKLYNQIKEQISAGKLLPHSKLPSVRHLSQELAISRNTVEYAYGQLCTEGYIYSKPQSGYYVSLLEQEFTPHTFQNTASPLEQTFEKPYLFDFHPAVLAPDSFPIKIWRKLLLDCLQKNLEKLSSYSNSQGEIKLRSEIQKYLERFRGVACTTEQIVICSGLQDSMSIIAQLLRAKHSTLAVEDPGHWIPKSVFQNNSYSIRCIPVNATGINLDYLQNSNSTIVYVTPSHQFPLGYTMPVENRLKLLHWAENVEGVIIEDDYDSELRYHGKPIPALQGLHPKGNIIYVGTFSKVLSPILRVSYMVLPYHLLTAYQQQFGNYAAAASLLEQLTLYEFMKQGYWERHLRKMRTVYRKKHDALLNAIERHFGNCVTILGQGAGLHLVIELIGNSGNEKDLICRAEEKNIRIHPLTDTYHSDNHQSAKIMLGFGKMTPEQLDKGIRQLAEAWHLCQ